MLFLIVFFVFIMHAFSDLCNVLHACVFFFIYCLPPLSNVTSRYWKTGVSEWPGVVFHPMIPLQALVMQALVEPATPSNTQPGTTNCNLGAGRMILCRLSITPTKWLPHSSSYFCPCRKTSLFYLFRAGRQASISAG